MSQSPVGCVPASVVVTVILVVVVVTIVVVVLVVIVVVVSNVVWPSLWSVVGKKVVVSSKLFVHSHLIKNPP